MSPAVRAWALERLTSYAHGPDGIVPRAPTRADLDAYSMRFKAKTGERRDGCVTTAMYEVPTTQEIEALQAIYTEFRVSLYGPAALEPRRRYPRLHPLLRGLVRE